MAPHGKNLTTKTPWFVAHEPHKKTYMNLTFSAQNLGWIAQFITDKQLWFKVKKAYQSSDKQSVTIPGISPQELISTYNNISAQPEGLAAAINRAVEAELMPQLVNEQGQPLSEETAQVVMWIVENRNNNLSQRTNQINAIIAQLEE